MRFDLSTATITTNYNKWCSQLFFFRIWSNHIFYMYLSRVIPYSLLLFPSVGYLTLRMYRCTFLHLIHLVPSGSSQNSARWKNLLIKKIRADLQIASPRIVFSVLQNTTNGVCLVKSYLYWYQFHLLQGFFLMKKKISLSLKSTGSKSRIDGCD